MAKTPWGDLTVNDAHVHFFSHAFYSGLARQKKTENVEALGALLSWEIPPADPAVLAKIWAEELDQHDVKRACLIASAPGDEDSVAAAVSAFPGRFFGYFMFDPLQPDAGERLERASRNSNLHGVCLFPAMHKYSVNDTRVRPVFDVAAKSGLVVFVHCGALSVGVRSKLGLPSPFDMRYSNPLELHPIALQFPMVRFVIPHFGAGLFREALMLADLCPNVFFDTSSTNRWAMYEGLELTAVFRRCIDVIGCERLLFGSDSSFFPRGWHAAILRDQLDALDALRLDAERAGMILGVNLEKLLGRA